MKDKGRNKDMKIGIANDHSAVDMKNEIVEYLKSLGYEVVNYGTDTYESCNYPEYHPHGGARFPGGYSKL